MCIGEITFYIDGLHSSAYCETLYNFIGGWMIELSHVKYALLFCARVLLRNLQRMFFVKKTQNTGMPIISDLVLSGSVD